MEDLSHSLTLAEIQRLRAHYDSNAVLALKVAATAAAHPPHAPWAASIREASLVRPACPRGSASYA